jgi:hypothetical protein
MRAYVSGCPHSEGLITSIAPQRGDRAFETLALQAPQDEVMRRLEGWGKPNEAPAPPMKSPPRRGRAGDFCDVGET